MFVELLELTMSHPDFRLAAMETFLRFLSYGAALTSVLALFVYALMLSREAGRRSPARTSAPRRRR
jgi:hypothetical protein